jgi:hypothetical protein
LRPPVDAGRIAAFLTALGRRYHGRGRILLVGGTSLVLEGFREQTLYIDLTFELPDGQHGAFIEAVQQLKHEMQINVEEASPAEFIPLPSGSDERARYIGRYGQLDVYHFDPYSGALSKIERGREGDIADVLALLRNDWLKWPDLAHRFDEIQPAYAVASLRADSVAFRAKFERLRVRWESEWYSPDGGADR